MWQIRLDFLFCRENSMPIYEYKCKKCGTVSEHIQRFSDEPLTDCGDCGSAGGLEKMISLSAFHLKGSGWYVTDYGGKNGSSDSNAETSNNTAKEASSTDSTSDSAKSTTSKSKD